MKKLILFFALSLQTGLALAKNEWVTTYIFNAHSLSPSQKTILTNAASAGGLVVNGQPSIMTRVLLMPNTDYYLISIASQTSAEASFLNINEGNGNLTRIESSVINESGRVSSEKYAKIPDDVFLPWSVRKSTP